MEHRPSFNSEYERQHQVEAIVAKDRQAFDVWFADPGHQKSFDIPHDAARFIAVPRRVLELVEQPQAVELIVAAQGDFNFDGLVVEKKSSSVLASELLDEQLLAKGILNDNDFVINRIKLLHASNNQFFIDEYEDCEPLRGMGVAQSFYGRLRQIAKVMGYRFMTGHNNERNIGFFTDKLGRSTLSQVKPELRGGFLNYATVSATPNLFTIDFLYPEDKGYYLMDGIII